MRASPHFSVFLRHLRPNIRDFQNLRSEHKNYLAITFLNVLSFFARLFDAPAAATLHPLLHDPQSVSPVKSSLGNVHLQQKSIQQYHLKVQQKLESLNGCAVLVYQQHEHKHTGQDKP